MTIQIKNWGEFQHFKNRDPIWIKLYRKILDDKEWHKLDGDSAKGLVMLWLLASEDDGYLPDISTISFRLRIPEESVSGLISKLSHWINSDDIKPISDRDQVGIPEKRREEKEKRGFVLPDWVSSDAWSAFEDSRKKLRKPLTDRARQLAVAELQRLRDQGHDPIAVIESAVLHGWQTFYPPKDSRPDRVRVDA